GDGARDHGLGTGASLDRLPRAQFPSAAGERSPGGKRLRQSTRMTHAVQFERPPANSRAKSLVSRALLRGQLRFAIPVSLELSANPSSARQVKCSPDRTSQAAAGNGILSSETGAPKP